jgi:hypothetical protein
MTSKNREADLMEDIAYTYARWSGAVRDRKLSALFNEIGRTVSEEEAQNVALRPRGTYAQATGQK